MGPNFAGAALKESWAVILKPKTVLVVEDDPANADLLVWLLVDAGYQTLRAANGQDALEELRSKCIDLVVTDVMMPIMDGLQLVDAVRGDRSLASIPVLIQTSGPEEAVRALGASIDGYLPKPFQKAVLLRKVAELLSPAYEPASGKTWRNRPPDGGADPGASSP
jgi:CheY-like chemotaxis protein